MKRPDSQAGPWLRLVRLDVPLARKLELAAPLVAGAPGASFEDAMTREERRLYVAHELARRAEEDLERLARAGAQVVTIACPAYPARLREIARPPLVLFVRGSLDVLSVPQLAVVGSRNASHVGLETARDFACSLARIGLAITSGLARGIDGAAHRGCLDAGAPTVAVAATGADRVYPARHGPLAEEIVAAGGAVVTEFAPGEPPRPHHFPRRNRIISGLSLGTLVVEAARASGSLITARCALEQDREVFAIPGSIHNPAARGCHQLIREGAKLVEQVDDIVDELALSCPLPLMEPAAPPSRQATPHVPRANCEEARVLAAVDFAPTDFDAIVRRTKLAAETVSAVLLELELRGLVCKSAGFFSRSDRKA